MIDSTTDIIAIGISIWQAVLIIYCLRMLGGPQKISKNGWAWFIVGLLGIFTGRLIFTLRCLEIVNYMYVQQGVMVCTTLAFWMFVRDRHRRCMS